MDAAKRRALEDAGWRFGDAADFLGMNDAERQCLDLRVTLASAIRQLREGLNLSQRQFGAMLQRSRSSVSGRSSVAAIERAASDVSMDQLVFAFTAAGGKIEVKSVESKTRKGRRPSARKTAIVLETGISE